MIVDKCNMYLLDLIYCNIVVIVELFLIVVMEIVDVDGKFICVVDFDVFC